MTNTYDETGISMDRYADVLARLIALSEAQWSESINTDENEILGNFLRMLALVLGEINEKIEECHDARSVLNAAGTQLDHLLALIFTDGRQDAAYSTATVTLTVTAATTIPAGSKVSTAAGTVWETDEAKVFVGAGSDTVGVTCTEAGAIEAAATEINTIDTPIYGWSAVSNAAAAIPGCLQETDGEYKERHTLAVATSGTQDPASIYEAVAAVSGVSSVYIYNNNTTGTVDSVPAHSVHVVVVGGSDANVAAAIANNLPSGTGTYGSTTVNHYDSVTGQVVEIKFSRATTVDCYVDVTINTNTSFPVTGEQDLKDAIVDYFATLEIGDDVIYNALYGPLFAVAGVTVTDLKLDDSDPPTGTSDVTISSIQIAAIEEDDIDITIS